MKTFLHLSRLLAGAAFVLSAGVAGARPLDDVKKSGFLRVAVYGENRPFSELDKDNKPVGIDVDLARAIAEQLKVRADIVVYQASENMDGDFRLNLWKGDLAGSPLADLMLQVPNDRALMVRNDQVFFTSPYFMQHLAYAYQKEKVERFESLNDIGTSKVAVEGTSSSDLALMTALGGRFRPNATHFASFSKAAEAFKAGETPILAGTEAQIDNAFFDYKISKEDDAIIVPSIMGPIKNHWELAGAVHSNSRDLGYAIGDILTAMVKDGRLKAICDKYGVKFTPPDL